MNAIDASYYDKTFNVSRYMLRYVVGASTDELRQKQLDRVVKYREIADREIGGVIEDNYINFNSSLAMFTTISNQNGETSKKLDKVFQRCTDGKLILGSKTKNLRELLLQKYEAKKVIDLIDEIQFIETAPVKIKAYLAQKKYTIAVETFNQALDLVFTDKLVTFHAITGLRTSLMECKQIIEEELVQALLNITFVKETIQSFTHQPVHSTSILERELLENTIFETEYEICIANKGSPQAKNCQFRPDQRGSDYNELKDAVNAVKRLRREVEVLGELQNSTETELELIVQKLTIIYHSCAAFSKSVECEQNQFGLCEHTATLQSFLHLLLDIFKRVIQRSLLVAYYFTSDGSEWKYHLNGLLKEISSRVQNVLNKYMETSADSTGSRINEQSDGLYSDLQLFRFAANIRPRDGKTTRFISSETDGVLNSMNDVEKQRSICLPNVFHFPIAYADLMQFATELEQYEAVYTKETSSSGDGIFREDLKQFIVSCWIPRVEHKAKQFINVKPKKSPTLRVPLDTNFQLPSTDSLMQISQCVCQIIQKMPSYEFECINVLDSTLGAWIGQMEAIVKEIQCSTLNGSISGSNEDARLISVYFDSETYKKAKEAVTIPYHMTNMMRLCAIFSDELSKSPTAGKNSTPSNDSKAAESISSLAVLIDQCGNITSSERIMEHEFMLERSLYDPSICKVRGRSLMRDMTRISMLAYICSASDMIAYKFQHISVYPEGKTISSTHASFQNTCLRCSELADTCLFFIRREVRLHCLFFLTQLIGQRFDARDDVSVAQHSVQSLNRSLSSMEHALHPFISNYKICFIFDGIDALCANILITNLQSMAKCVFTKEGVAQMLLNIGAIHQKLSGLLFSYPRIGSIESFYHFHYARRYYQLLLLQETQLELYVLENRKMFSANAFRALWHVETPHRILKQGSINKLESLLLTSDMQLNAASASRLMTGITHSRRLQRAFSTVNAPSLSSDAYSFVKMRQAYQAEVSDLRKIFFETEARRKEKLAYDAEVKRLKIMKEKAARMEIKRQKQALRAQEVARDRELQEAANRKYFEEKARVRLIYEEERARRRAAILNAFKEESANWITQENYQEKLKDEVFMYTPQLRNGSRSFDVLLTTAGSSALSWLEKLKRMRPSGAQGDTQAPLDTRQDGKEMHILDLLPKKIPEEE
uniref:Exocyst complex component Sec8 n=1 Tax=Albugo laibachii Nc14 TaxID=890382 RepID=F0W5T7_9STRA|nr:exocyst complex component 4 putative [Albugo laibachii Nc14]|eukprot:CCA16478.1 exocyst complex component 4 putative [Albugo laibachii Nc14]